MEIQQDERLRAIRAAAIRTTGFAGCFIDIDPALLETLPKSTDIIFP